MGRSASCLWSLVFARVRCGWLLGAGLRDLWSHPVVVVLSPWIGGIPCHPACPLWYQSISIIVLHKNPIGWYVRNPSILWGFSTAILYLLSWILPYLFHRHLWRKRGLVHGKLTGSLICRCGPYGGCSYGVSDHHKCWAIIGTEWRNSSSSENAWWLQGSVLLME